MPTNDIIRDGFVSSFGKICVRKIGGRWADTERIDASRLRAMFFPRLTAEAKVMLNNRCEFVRCQFKHYGVEFDEKEFIDQRTALMKKALRAGKVGLTASYLAH